MFLCYIFKSRACVQYESEVNCFRNSGQSEDEIPRNSMQIKIFWGVKILKKLKRAFRAGKDAVTLK